MTHLVSAFLNEGGNRLVLGQLAVEDKSNETVAIPRLLELLDLRGAVVTIDAIGCQRAVAAKVIARGGDYLLPVKDNQPALHAKVGSLGDELLVLWPGLAGGSIALIERTRQDLGDFSGKVSASSDRCTYRAWPEPTTRPPRGWPATPAGIGPWRTTCTGNWT
jgi:hypothetical protein